MVRNEHYTLKSARCIYGKIWALHIEQYKLNLSYEISITHRTVQGTLMVRIEHYTVNSVLLIYDTNWALHSEQCKLF